MKAVIDIGCARYGGDHSIERLIEWYIPDVLYGFDADDSLVEGESTIGATRVILEHKVAWLHDGNVGFAQDGLNGHVDERVAPRRCFSLTRFILGLNEDEIILKLDCEGSEYPLLEDLAASGAHERLSRVLVEWHCSYCRRGGWSHHEHCKGDQWEARRAAIIARLSCPVEEWNW